MSEQFRCVRCGGVLRSNDECRFCLERDRLANGAFPTFVLSSREMWVLILVSLVVGCLIGRFLR